MKSDMVDFCIIAIGIVFSIFAILYVIYWFKKRLDIKPGDIKTKEEEDEFMPEYEKVEKAEEIINNPQPMIPGLGNQNPIKTPTEEVEVDPSDMPWELKDAEDAKEDE